MRTNTNILGFIIVIGACGDNDSSPRPDAQTGPDASVPIACTRDSLGMQLPEGFCATIFADNLVRPRHLAVTPSGDVLVALNPARDGSSPGAVLALRDADRDGRAEMQMSLDSQGGNGVVWHDGHLFVGENDRIVRYQLPDGMLVPEGPPTTIVDGLPATGDHVSKSIAVDRDGRIVANIGSASNSCQVMNRAVESPGVDPCPERSSRAGIWRFDDAPAQTPADGDHVAVGIRNAVALAIEPMTGAIVAIQQGRDQLFAHWPGVYGEPDEQRLPDEELFVITADGNDFGWPYCYFDSGRGRKVQAPEYAGDGEMLGRCAEIVAPDMTFPAHWAPIALAFYTGGPLPDRYDHGAFVTFHGSRFAPAAAETELPGYSVAFVPFSDGKPTGQYELFATGFAGSGRPLPESASHRPAGIAIAPDGSLYVSDDQGGRIWHIYYSLAQ